MEKDIVNDFIKRINDFNNWEVAYLITEIYNKERHYRIAVVDEMVGFPEDMGYIIVTEDCIILYEIEKPENQIEVELITEFTSYRLN